MSKSSHCDCCAAPTLLFPCSGGSDVGALTDLTARQMTKDGIGNMYCIAGIGGRVSGILATTEAAEKILAIDGCPINCAKKTLENAGFTNFYHVQLSDLGFKKGQSPLNDENIKTISEKCKNEVIS